MPNFDVPRTGVLRRLRRRPIEYVEYALPRWLGLEWTVFSRGKVTDNDLEQSSLDEGQHSTNQAIQCLNAGGRHTSRQAPSRLATPR